MHEIFTAPTLEAAEKRFAPLAEEWESRHPATIDTGGRFWADFTPFF
jgi:hypothetical protein